MMHRYQCPANAMDWILYPTPIILMLPYPMQPMLPRVKHFSHPHSSRALYSNTHDNLGKKRYVGFNGLRRLTAAV